jgi:hypothetical protein
MMLRHHRVYRADDSYSTIVLDRSRELIAESVRLLRESAPDTFLGRRRRETVPVLDEER